MKIMEDKELELGTEIAFEDLTQEEQDRYYKEMFGDCITEDDTEEYYENYDEENMPYEEEMGKLTVAEEVRRLEAIKDEFKPLDTTLDGKFYNKGMEIAETIVAMVKVMNNNGIDYQNALTIANNYFMAEMQKDLDSSSKDRYTVGI